VKRIISDVDVYDLVLGSWSTHQEPLPVETAAGVIDDKIHYVGGEAGRLDAFTDMQIFNPSENTWVKGPSLNRARLVPTAVYSIESCG
jgi:hypothetical protein